MSRAEAPLKVLVLKTDKVLFPEGRLEIQLTPSNVGLLDFADKAALEQSTILVLAKEPAGAKSAYTVGTLATIAAIPPDAKGKPAVLRLEGLVKGNVKQLAADKAGDLRAVVERADAPTAANSTGLAHEMDIASNRIEKYLDHARIPKALLPSLSRAKNQFLDSLSYQDAPEETVGKLTTFLVRRTSIPTADMQAVLEMADPRRQVAEITRLVEEEIVRQGARAVPAGKEHLYSTLVEEEKEQARLLREKQKQEPKKLPPKSSPPQEASKGEKEMDELEEMAKKIKDTQLPPETRAIVEKGFKRLQGMNPQSSEADVQRNYLDTLLDMPWGKNDPINTDIAHAKEVLDKDHYGLERVKDEITKFMAVQKRAKGTGKAPILCFVGPPGVGKTSIVRSIAEATGQKYVRLALGGVKDESEIRGHRRTFVGAMPGQIVKSLKKVKSNNPVFVLDEIDKMASDTRGDPAAALLEVLDPEQNNSFKDHYLDMDYDLSKVTFIATANDYGSIPGPLRDRMHVIRLGSYTSEEKMEIAARHLVGQAMKETGLTDKEFSVDNKALHRLITEYTAEAGVRDLKRKLVNLCSTAVQKIETGEIKTAHITDANLETFAGKSKAFQTRVGDEPEVGHGNGMAFTSVGGCLIPIEAVTMPSKAFSAKATGQLGDVMKESVQKVTSYIRSHAAELHLSDKDLQKEVHVDAVEGGVPKDGPSAGAIFATVLYSVLKNEPIRHDVAMTGEITMRGKVTPIGGVREKLTGAFNAGVKKVLLPKENYIRDLDDVPANVRTGLEIVPIGTIVEAFRHALVNGRVLFPESRNDNMPDTPANDQTAPPQSSVPQAATVKAAGLKK